METREAEVLWVLAEGIIGLAEALDKIARITNDPDDAKTDGLWPVRCHQIAIDALNSGAFVIAAARRATGT